MSADCVHFYNVTGKGTHALLAGHCNRKGENVFHIERNNDNVITTDMGVVRVCQNEHVRRGSIDAALAKLNDDIPYSSHVQIGTRTVHLDPDPGDVLGGTVVHKFCNQADPVRGIVKYANYNHLNVAFKCTAIIKEDSEGYFHDVGESGTIVVADKPDDVNTVKGVGILFAKGFLPKTEDETGKELGYQLSLAVPLKRSLHSLSTDDYCSGSKINFCSEPDI